MLLNVHILMYLWWKYYTLSCLQSLKHCESMWLMWQCHHFHVTPQLRQSKYSWCQGVRKADSWPTVSIMQPDAIWVKRGDWGGRILGRGCELRWCYAHLTPLKEQHDPSAAGLQSCQTDSVQPPGKPVQAAACGALTRETVMEIEDIWAQ